MTKFCKDWRHKFPSGRKGATVLAFGRPTPCPSEPGTVGDEPPSVAHQLTALGISLDAALSFDSLLSQACAVLLTKARELWATMSDYGFGLPFQIYRLGNRVESAALFGCELLASYAGGWPQVVRRINDAHYNAAKFLLGLPAGVSLGAGGHVKVFPETRFLTRLAGRVAERIVMTHCRTRVMDASHPVRTAWAGTKRVVGSTWFDDAAAVARAFGVPEFMPGVDCPSLEAARAKQTVRSWKLRCGRRSKHRNGSGSANSLHG